MAKVSVLMSVRNGETWLSEAIQSILGQTLGDFEFIIIDDASKDGTGQILQGLNDPRIRIVRNDTERGQAASLNRGLSLCRSQYIARMDADDIAVPDRLERQATFLDRNPCVGIVGGGAIYFDAHGNVKRELRKPSDPLHLEWTALWSAPFVQSTVMFRKDLADGFDLEFNADSGDACDLDYWYRAMRITGAANLEDLLARRRWHHEALQIRSARERRSARNEIHMDNMNNYMGISYFTAEDISAIRQVMNPSSESAQGIQLESLRKFKRLLDVYCHRKRRERGVRAFYLSELRHMSRQIVRHLGPVAVVPILCSFEKKAA